MANSYVNCMVHYVFSTKNRANLIPADVQPKLWAYLGGIARNNEIKALAAGGTANHAHVLASLPATMSVAKAVQLLKGGSSKWIHETFPACAAFEWQDGYAAFSIGVSGVEKTVEYIRSQDQHHRTHTFEQEYVGFLERHGVAFDPRYVLG